MTSPICRGREALAPLIFPAVTMSDVAAPSGIKEGKKRKKEDKEYVNEGKLDDEDSLAQEEALPQGDTKVRLDRE